MSNKHSGAIVATIGGEEYTFKATLDALCEIEDATGKDFTTFAAGMANGISIRELLTCAKAFAKAGGSKNAKTLGSGSADLEGLSKAVGSCIESMFPEREEKAKK